MNASILFRFGRIASFIWQASASTVLTIAFGIAYLASVLMLFCFLLWFILFTNSMEMGDDPVTFLNVLKDIGIFIGVAASGALWAWLSSKGD